MSLNSWIKFQSAALLKVIAFEYLVTQCPHPPHFFAPKIAGCLPPHLTKHAAAGEQSKAHMTRCKIADIPI